MREVMRVESGGRTEMNGAPITSGAGAMGLMQVMPATYDELRGRYWLGDDPYDPHNSILAGTAYIRELYDLYGSPGFLAAYNGGPGRLDDYLTRNRALPEETRRYVAKIGPYITDSFPNKRSTAETYAMNSLPTSIPAGPRYSAPTARALRAAAPWQHAARSRWRMPRRPTSDGAFDPPPGWTPKAMPRAEVAAYVRRRPPLRAARAAVAGDLRQRSTPGPPSRAAPAAAALCRRPVRRGASPLPPVPAPRRAPQYAALPSRRAATPPAPTVQTASAYGFAQRRTEHAGFRLWRRPMRPRRRPIAARPASGPSRSARSAMRAWPASRSATRASRPAPCCPAPAGRRRRAGAARHAVSRPADRPVAGRGDAGLRAAAAAAAPASCCRPTPSPDETDIAPGDEPGAWSAVRGEDGPE